MKRKAHIYQRRAERFILDNPQSGVFLHPGLGKTSISLSVIQRLRKMDKIKAALIVAPLRPCYLVWPNELKKWDFDLTMRILHGKDKDAELASPADVYVINPEGLRWLFRVLKGKRTWPFDCLIADESTKWKHPNTARFKLLKKKLYKFPRRHILTGTPAPNGLMDLFGQMYLVDEGKCLGEKITHFQNKYFFKTGYMGYEWKLQPQADKRIHRAIAPKVIQMRAEDYLTLPDLIINDIWVDLPPETMKAYREVEKDFRTDFEDGRVTAANAAVMSSKCRQLASGGIYLDKTGEAFGVHSAKTEAVADLVEELMGNPVLIAYEFKHDLTRLLEKFGKDTPYIGGGMSMKQSQKIEGQWNRGELPILLGQSSAVAHGLNLQECGSTIIWHTLTWNSEDYEQLIARLWRQGQKSKQVIVHRILARKTIDEIVVSSLSSKDKVQRNLFSALKGYWRE